MAERSSQPARTPFRKNLHFRVRLSHWPPLGKYALALVITAISLAVRRGLDPWLGNRTPAALIVPAVVFLAVFVGMGPAIVATLFGLLGAVYWFVLPRNSFDGRRPRCCDFALVLPVNLRRHHRHRRSGPAQEQRTDCKRGSGSARSYLPVQTSCTR